MVLEKSHVSLELTRHSEVFRRGKVLIFIPPLSQIYLGRKRKITICVAFFFQILLKNPLSDIIIHLINCSWPRGRASACQSVGLGFEPGLEPRQYFHHTFLQYEIDGKYPSVLSGGLVYCSLQSRSQLSSLSFQLDQKL